MNADAIWKTKDGRSIPVTEMTTEHIFNALDMLRRQGYVGASAVKFYLSSRRPRGEMAQDAFEQEFDYVLNAPVHPFVDIFREELQRRREGEP